MFSTKPRGEHGGTHFDAKEAAVGVRPPEWSARAVFAVSVPGTGWC